MLLCEKIIVEFGLGVPSSNPGKYIRHSSLIS